MRFQVWLTRPVSQMRARLNQALENSESYLIADAKAASALSVYQDDQRLTITIPRRGFSLSYSKANDILLQFPCVIKNG